MIVERLQVEGGFLDGLDLELFPGLNVIIGPRGVGKTSVIELLRFGLGLSAYTEAIDRRARQHALAVLGEGTVTVTISDSGVRRTVTRTGARESASVGNPPIVLSQNEIETLGLDDFARLRLLDALVDVSEREHADEALAAIRSNTAEIATQTLLRRSLGTKLDAYRELDNQIANVEQFQESSSASGGQIGGLKAELDRLSSDVARATVAAEALKHAVNEVALWQRRLREVSGSTPVLAAWSADLGPADELRSIRSVLATFQREITALVAELDSELQVARSGVISREELVEKLSSQAQLLRKQLEDLQEGSGKAARRLADLRQQAALRTALREQISTVDRRIDLLRGRRSEWFREIEATRDARFKARLAAAERLNQALGPIIRARVTKSGLGFEYESALASALRGSGLHYKTLAKTVADRLSPRELVDYVEIGNAAGLAEIADISSERAERLVQSLQTEGLAEVVAAPLEDDARFELLSGGDYRDISTLSTGQRCTVILPIILSQPDRALVVDQPEDHLDNAFIVDTVVTAIRQRPTKAQLICATHNPNIPVLGEASRVVVLGSDGQRGFVQHAGPLSEPATVDAITGIMEGGREALRRRAAFYEGRSVRWIETKRSQP